VQKIEALLNKPKGPSPLEAKLEALAAGVTELVVLDMESNKLLKEQKGAIAQLTVGMREALNILKSQKPSIESENDEL
jgi:hypothetical protein